MAGDKLAAAMVVVVVAGAGQMPEERDAFPEVAFRRVMRGGPTRGASQH